MKLYLLSLGVGVLVGVLYGALNVRSPAPPILALLGLFGMLVGEQIVPVARRVLAGEPLSAVASECAPKITGAPPPEPAPTNDGTRSEP